MVSWWWVGCWRNSMVVRWLVTPRLTLIDTSVDTWLSVSRESTNFWLMHVPQLSAWSSVDVSSRMLVECWSRCLSILVNRSIYTCPWMPLLHMVLISLVLYHYAMNNWYHFVNIRSKSKTISWVIAHIFPSFTPATRIKLDFSSGLRNFLYCRHLVNSKSLAWSLKLKSCILLCLWISRILKSHCLNWHSYKKSTCMWKLDLLK